MSGGYFDEKLKWLVYEKNYKAKAVELLFCVFLYLIIWQNAL